ncbi:hypothetical protein Tco_0332844, partial [Tanacetum coccineum]
SLKLAITISWFLAAEVVESFKNVVEYETHFILNLMDEGLSALAMRTRKNHLKPFCGEQRLFKADSFQFLVRRG